MNTPLALDILICAAICLRVLLFNRRGSVHRPLASFLAWVVVVAAGAVTLLGLFGELPTPSAAEVVLHLVLCLAVFSARGNVVELFRTSEAESCIYRLIRRTPHA